MEVTTVYVGILGIAYFALSMRTILGRGKNKISLGTGNSDDMLRRVRTHANFSEYVPLLIIILGLLEYHKVSEVALHIYGVAIVLGRALHFYGLLTPTTPMWSRVLGMQLTLFPLLLGALALIYMSLS